ncbi:unnamed protein product [Arabidopsis arenosa]|uniref:EGF-like domain-containing protein n=1 Tax=Arabidopsis arenosa TaxID=38785 RepID=A0A8S1ZHK8_ARAAE|nr:unnamed protein product [Arabidopsis arenosa]
MKLQEGVFLVAIFFFLGYTQLVKGQHQPRPDCQTRCGNLKIEYPFGISPGCYYDEYDSFNVTCDNEKEKLFIGINVEVVNFNHSAAQLSVLFNRSSDCDDEKRNETNETSIWYRLGSSSSLSPKNKFTLVGCNALALLSTFGKQNYSTGCLSLCDSQPEANGECNGVGCCRTEDFSVPSDSYQFQYGSARLGNQTIKSVDLFNTSVYQFNPCTYAFLVEDGKFNFNSSQDLRNLRNVTRFPVALDWSIGNKTCEQVGSTNICGGNTKCFDSTRGKGYICKCKDGFDGNPYLLDGCQDINECTTGRHNCSNPSTCENTLGSFLCKCPSGRELNTTTMSSCTDTPKEEEPKYLGLTIVLLGCYYDEYDSFNVTCDDEKEKLFIGINVEVVNFNHSAAKLSVLFNRSSDCDDEQRNETNETSIWYRLGSSFSLSPRNKFTLVGCNALALLSTFGKQNYSTGCLSLCDSQPEANGECNGVGCCRTEDFSVPSDSYQFQYGSARLGNQTIKSVDLFNTSVYQFNPCTYAFLVEDGKFNFNSSQDLKNLRNVTRFPVALDWAIGNKTCEQAGSTSICGGNTKCFDSTRGKGYICKCKDGYNGNPYLLDGCQDINECTTRRHNCSDPSTCENTLGSFLCKCPSGRDLNTTTMSSCTDTPKEEEPKYLGWTIVLLGKLSSLVFDSFVSRKTWAL